MRALLKNILLLFPLSLSAGINFYSRNAALETANGSLTFTNTNATLSKGTLRSIGTGTISNDASEYLNCTKMKVATDASTTKKEMVVDGQLYLNDATMTLSDNDMLAVDGGQVAQTVSVTAAAASPAIIHGDGSFAAPIEVDATAAAAAATLRWQGQLNQNIVLTTDDNAATLNLENNTAFMTGKGPTVSSATNTGTINFNGYALTLGGSSATPLDLGSVRYTWDRAKLILNGDISVGAIIDATDSTSTGDGVSIVGNGHKMHVVSGGIEGIGSNNSMSNVHVIDYGSGLVAGGTRWDVKNTTVESSSTGQKLRLVSGRMLGTVDRPLSGFFSCDDARADIELLTPVTLSGTWYFGNGFNLVGNGNVFDFNSNYIRFHSPSYMSNVILKNVSGPSFYTVTTLGLQNVEWHDAGGNGAVRVSPPKIDNSGFEHAILSMETSTFTDAGYLFDNDCTWSYGVHLTFLSNATLNATWRLYGTGSNYASQFDGDGHLLNLENGTVDYEGDFYLSNITLAGMTAASLDRDTGEYLYLTDVTWIDSAGQSVRVAGSIDDAGTINAAKVLMDATNTGDLFSSPVTWDNGARIELLSDVTLGDVWTFSQNSTIDGNGHVLDITGVTGALTVATTKTLTLRNVVLKGWGTGTVVFGANNATLSLANVTVIMNSGVTLGATELLSIDGPLTFVTRASIFDATAGTTNHTHAGGTVWFDIGGTLGSDTKVLFDDAASIPVRMMPRTITNLSIGDDGVSAPATHIEDSLWLTYKIDTGSDGLVETPGRQLRIHNNNAVTIRGNGRTLYFGATPQSSLSTETSNKLLTATGHASNVIELHDLIIDNWAPEHIDDTNNVLRYCEGSTIRLRENQTLTTTINIGNDMAGETIVLDLNGHDLDFAADAAGLTIANNNLTLIIRNGRLVNMQDGSGGEIKINAGGTTSTIIFQDVDILLSGDTTFEQHNMTFKGSCAILGNGHQVTCTGTQLTIASGATLRVGRAATVALDDDGGTDASLTFASSRATLFLEGATFDVSGLTSAPAFTTGTMRVDDVTTLIGDMTLGSATASLALTIDLLPEANMRIRNGAVTYANNS